MFKCILSLLKGKEFAFRKDNPCTEGCTEEFIFLLTEGLHLWEGCGK